MWRKNHVTQLLEDLGQCIELVKPLIAEVVCALWRNRNDVVFGRAAKNAENIINDVLFRVHFTKDSPFFVLQLFVGFFPEILSW